jgi:NTP pyrophosphatase (non-canonical NTP hydrolase)
MGMTIDEYAAWAARVPRSRPDNAMPRDETVYLAYLGLGLAGEAGEVVEHIKKLLRDGAWNPDRLAEELGDVVYYWACLCLAAGRSPSDVLAASAAKIDARLAARGDGPAA